MNVWQSDEWKKYYNSSARKGIRLFFDAEVDAEVRRSCKEFVKWLRTVYDFPVRVNVYVKAKEKIKAKDGELVYGIFFRPNEVGLEPYIKIATGDYLSLKAEVGKDNALAASLDCLAHEITHYFQYINNVSLTLRGEEAQASNYARKIMSMYSDVREHP